MMNLHQTVENKIIDALAFIERMESLRGNWELEETAAENDAWVDAQIDHALSVLHTLGAVVVSVYSGSSQWYEYTTTRADALDHIGNEIVQAGRCTAEVTELGWSVYRLVYPSFFEPQKGLVRTYIVKPY